MSQGLAKLPLAPLDAPKTKVFMRNSSCCCSAS